MIPPPQGVTLTELKEAEKAIGRIGEEQPIREGERREEQPPESTVGGGQGGGMALGGGGQRGILGVLLQWVGWYLMNIMGCLWWGHGVSLGGGVWVWGCL